MDDKGRRQQRGVTLVELVCVLVILGVLGALALPRFMDMGSAAHSASVGSTADAFRSALTIASSSCALRGWAGRDNLPGYGGGNVDFNTACFPTDTTGNANTIASTAARCQRVWGAILASAPSITTLVSGADYRARANNNVCTYLYLLDSSATRQFTYDSRNGLVVVTNP